MVHKKKLTIIVIVTLRGYTETSIFYIYVKQLAQSDLKFIPLNLLALTQTNLKGTPLKLFALMQIDFVGNSRNYEMTQ